MKLYPRIPHLPGSTGTDDDLRESGAHAARFFHATTNAPRVIVTEKLDGTCVAIERRGDEAIALGRDGRPCASSRNEGRRAFAAFVAAHPERWSSLGQGERLICEWLALAHSVRYDLPHEPAVVIDLFAARTHLPFDAAVARAEQVGLPSVAVLHDGAPCSLAHALAALGVGGRHGADNAEGLIYRLERQRDGAVLAQAKYVRPGFSPGSLLPDRAGATTWNRWRGPWTHDDLLRALAD